MALSEKEQAVLKQTIGRITSDIRNKEDIFDGYKKDPSKKHLVSGLTNEINGLKRALESYKAKLR